MNARTARLPGGHEGGLAAAYVSLGAGTRAAAGPGADAGARALDAVRRVNRAVDHPVPVGALGDLAHGLGLRTAVIGSDAGPGQGRSAELVLADSTGAVDRLSTGPASLERWVAAPYGVRARLAAYRAPLAAGLTAWVFGDVGRARRYAPLCVPAAARRHEREALTRLDAFLAGPVRRAARSAAILLLAPDPPDARRGDRLAPILLLPLAGRRGRLTSASTRTPGVVTNADVLPTVAALLGASPPPRGVGRAAMVVPAERAARPPLAGWAGLHAALARTARLQALFGGMPLLQAALGLAVAGSLLVTRPRAGAIGSAACGALVAIPLALLLLPAVVPREPIQATVAVAACLLAAAALCGLSPRRAPIVGVVLAGALTGAVWLDLATGARLQRAAWMSYSVMEGARFYGIGNEYAGAVCGAAIVAVGLLAARPAGGIWLAGGLLASLALLIGLPGAGANLGGLAGACVGFGAAALGWWRGTAGRQTIALLLVAALALAAVVIAADLLAAAGSQSHIGRALGSAAGLPSVAARKAALNVHLLLHSPWSLALAASGTLLAGVRRVLPGRRLAWNAVVAGAAAMLVMNDSGVVAAALCAAVGGATLALAGPVGGWLDKPGHRPHTEA
ncbi:MAG: hypothetical protein IT208_07270 [Chthonomonadales bacterium]|nr:hypothetical protein [Chthonomonadales bacterium]